jgi:hypothetical protein
LAGDSVIAARNRTTASLMRPDNAYAAATRMLVFTQPPLFPFISPRHASSSIAAWKIPLPVKPNPQGKSIFMNVF